MFAFFDVMRPGVEARDVLIVMRLWTGVLALVLVILFVGAVRSDWVNREYWMSRVSSILVDRT